MFHFGRKDSTAITNTNSGSSIPNDVKTKICWLRSFFLFSMIASAAICGSITFTTVQKFELDLTEQSYYSVASSALKSAQVYANRKVQGAAVMASIVSFQFPNASMWPSVALAGFTETGLMLTEETQSTFGLGVIVQPDEVAEFEAFAAQVFQEQNYPNDTGVGDFGFGIWKNNEDPTIPGKVHDTSGNTTWGGNHSFLVPMFQHTNKTAKVIMSNLYAGQQTGEQVDDLWDCTKDANVSSVVDCGVLTGFITLRSRPGPGVAFYLSVQPRNDQATMVGLITTTFTWEEILNDSVPDYIQGLYIVVSTGVESYTYLMEAGIPTLLGTGDLHDPSFDQYAIVATIGEGFSQAVTSAVYNLTVYPSKQLFETNTGNPEAWAIAMGFVAVIVFSTALFFIYDILMRNEARQQKVILEVKRRFVRFVSHEIRTPLNTVCLGLELLLSDLGSVDSKADDGNYEPETKKEPTPNSNVLASALSMVDDILENANNAVGILNDLLNYDKMEHGTLTLELGAVAIWDVISRTVSSFDLQAQKRSIELTCRIDSPQNEEYDQARLKVWGDDIRIRQVVRNIVSNSLKFCPEGNGKIVVSLTHNPDGLPNAVLPRSGIVDAATSNTLICTYPRAGSIRISVSDNGVGMSDAQLQRLFQEGVQFEPNKLQDGGGSGLGLHITKQLVELHGGTIEMHSDGIGLGCVTTVELPLYSCFKQVKSFYNPAMTESPTTERKSSIVPVHKKLHKCLVVDDSLPNRKMLVRLLERAGHTCLSAGNGQEAVEIMDADHAATIQDKNHEPIDSILMDYEMPVLNGPDATKVLRSKGYKKVKVIGVTGNVLVDDVATFTSAGANKVLPKPITLALIEECWEVLTDQNGSTTTMTY